MTDKEPMKVEDAIKMLGESLNECAKLSYSGLEQLNEAVIHIEKAMSSLYDRVTKLEDELNGNNNKH